MEKPYSEIIGLPVLIEGLGRASRITDILIDSKNGSIAAFFVAGGRMKIIAPMDILFFGQAVVIGDMEDIIDAEELIKAKQIIEKDIWILGSRVKTKKGEDLGNVHDYYVDTTYFGLTKIVVYKSYFGLFKTPERIIPSADIIDIKKDLIIVKNDWAKEKITAKEETVKRLHPDMAA